MKQQLYKSLSVLIIVAATIILDGCHPFVKYPSSTVMAKPTAIGAAAGLTTGAIIGSSGAGALAGAGIGLYSNSPVHWLRRLQADGVQVIQTGYIVKIVIPTDKIFIFNTDSILPRSYPILTDVAQFIQNYGPVNITVNGYTDNVGSTVASLNLSIGQAKSVLAYLWARGIPSANLRAIGHGQANPIADNIDSIGSAWNRRIEITFAYG